MSNKKCYLNTVKGFHFLIGLMVGLLIMLILK